MNHACRFSYLQKLFEELHTFCDIRTRNSKLNTAMAANDGLRKYQRQILFRHQTLSTSLSYHQFKSKSHEYTTLSSIQFNSISLILYTIHVGCLMHKQKQKPHTLYTAQREVAPIFTIQTTLTYNRKASNRPVPRLGPIMIEPYS